MEDLLSNEVTEVGFLFIVFNNIIRSKRLANGFLTLVCRRNGRRLMVESSGMVRVFMERLPK